MIFNIIIHFKVKKKEKSRPSFLKKVHGLAGVNVSLLNIPFYGLLFFFVNFHIFRSYTSSFCINTMFYGILLVFTGKKAVCKMHYKEDKYT